ncbi:unnamed protein product [Schistocephalus solidus]|uniref:Uncharacterized protein n=1 Tax=Schistocephalus solidus TaxID=70667 RepID=A0A3P7ELY1_SCHSO|nr:unnamed protein product [Schistocephalus solidus]
MRRRLPVNLGVFYSLSRSHASYFCNGVTTPMRPTFATNSMPSALPVVSMENTIMLAACREFEDLPQHPDLPADLFTACLTTPIRTALKWHWLQYKEHFPGSALLDRIPGSHSNRMSLLGEINWIFTAVTDTIAWCSFSGEIFQKLFRQDLLVASLFRNFLLAERIMRMYGSHPCSWPALKPTHDHSMWSAWDHSLDRLFQFLPQALHAMALVHPSDPPPGADFRPASFFTSQMTAFKAWLSVASGQRQTATQLPILLQVLLSQGHRIRALQLLSEFLDLGPWAVSHCLTVGILPYIVRLFHSNVPEVKPHLVFIWGKIIASAHTDFGRNEAVRESGYKYFTACLRDSANLSPLVRTLAAFALAKMLEELQACRSDRVHLRLWLILALARLWYHNDEARWCGVRHGVHEVLYTYLRDVSPEVRAATVFALGTFVNNWSANRRDDVQALEVGGQVDTAHLRQRSFVCFVFTLLNCRLDSTGLTSITSTSQKVCVAKCHHVRYKDQKVPSMRVNFFSLSRHYTFLR